MGNTYNPRAWDGVTPLNNGTADAGISAAEGQTAGSVNNGMRGIMSGVKNALDDIGGALVAGGTANAITLTTKQNLSAAHIAAGLTLSFRATATNTGATTLNPDTTGAVAIVDQYGNALTGGEITSGTMCVVMYNANTSKWHLLTPGPAGFGSKRASFSAHKNGSAQVVTTTPVKVTFGTEVFDQGGFFASSTWTPPAGVMLITATCYFTGVAAGSQLWVILYKNGSIYKSQQIYVGTSMTSVSLNIQTIDRAVGTDTYEIYTVSDDASYTISGTSSDTYFMGAML